MSWLADLSQPTGARWSCGAYWADASSPSASDTDWEDPADWPKAYSAASALIFGVYVGGDDVTAYTQSASWSLGNSNPLQVSLTPSSCSLQLTDDVTPVVSDRVVILTQWDVLWVGTVEETGTVTDVERTTVDVQATDDLVRAAAESVEDKGIGGATMEAADALLRRAGIAGRAWSDDPDTHTAPGWASVGRAKRSGGVLELLAEMLWITAHLATWTPAGLRVCPVWLEDAYDAPVETLDDLNAITRSRSVQDVRDSAVIGPWALPTVIFTYDDDASVQAYGERVLAVDGTDWQDGWVGPEWASLWFQVWAGMDHPDYFTNPRPAPTFKRYADPRERIAADANVTDGRHTLARLVPFDTISDGAQATAANDRWRVLRVSHSLSPDSWGVSLEGIETGDPS